MTRFEKIQELSLEEMSRYICDFFSDQELCCRCVGYKLCKKGHKGTDEWLKEEIHEN